jgi:hypothetical protein
MPTVLKALRLHSHLDISKYRWCWEGCHDSLRA